MHMECAIGGQREKEGLHRVFASGDVANTPPSTRSSHPPLCSSARVRSVNPWSQHVRARGFYCWPDVARRTARVYDEAVREEGVDDMLGRLQRYHKVT